ncbi:hypothetical protein BBK36DRAFT_1119393 [Trichoderma citrinoviride]|uniref:Uncharacterized protein n=1 Tax=Trichoderma citrinoviride TaxID=58853 RepID=A0A2T4BAK0_9HYPO|nr:hypothetical protein BBK36DRAFT_1119393 [Trichoderma citrinoviride]PTB66347.1 hypothetical protein BBK36DRAFT_1119393 [Trichoderma citrinoviride]
MDYSEIYDPTTPFQDAMSLDGPPDDMGLVQSGYVGSRIRDLNIKTSQSNLKAQTSPYVTDTREDAAVCSPACQRARLEVTASPPVGHSYPGLRVYDDHIDDNGVAWEVAATSSHRFNVKPSLRASKSSNSVSLQSPTRGQNRFRNSHMSNESVVNRAGEARSNFKSPMRSQANLRASLPPFQTVHEILDSSKKEQQDALDMFDMYGVSRPEGLSSEKERQEAVGKTVQVCHSCGGHLHTRARCARCGHEFCVKCRTELVSGLSTNLGAGRGRGKDEGMSKQEACRHGVTHSQSVTNLSQPVHNRDRTLHRLSHSKSSDAVSTYLGRSQCSHAEAERHAYQQLRHERRQRLDKSHSETVSAEQQYACPACHVSTDPARHSICCIARQSQSGQEPVGQSTGGEYVTYKSSSNDSFRSAQRKLGVDEQAVMAASLSSGYTTAEPFSTQKPDRHVLSEETASKYRLCYSPSSRSHTHGTRHDKDRQFPTQRRMHGPGNETTAHAQQAMEQDAFWISSEGPGTPRQNNVPQSGGGGHQNTPRLTLEGVELDSELSRSSTSVPGKAVWTTPATSPRILPSRDADDTPGPPRDTKYDKQTRSTGKQQPQVPLRGDRGSPARRANNLTPETANRSGRGTLGSRDSVKVASVGKSPQQTIESSDPSTWRRQLRKLNDTPASGAGSPRKEDLVSSPDFDRRLRQSPAQSSKKHQAEAAVEESKMASDKSSGDSEMPISHHICEWRTRYLGLSSAFDKLKLELGETLDQQESQRIADEESERQRYRDGGIEGLTIIVHRRFREDLVLNTDLKED